jgi:ABC-type molybdate transport system ATPase subunit
LAFQARFVRLSICALLIDATRSRVNRVVAAWGIGQDGRETILDCLFRNFLGGPQPRVTLVRAIAAKPALLVLDEPMAGMLLQLGKVGPRVLVGDYLSALWLALERVHVSHQVRNVFR